MPEAVDLVLERPAILPALNDVELRRHVHARLNERELELIEERRTAGKHVLGWKAVVEMSFWTVPNSIETMFGTVPTFSADDSRTRARAARTKRSFLDAYRAAIERFMAGEHWAQFPFGTWLMRVRFGVPCWPLPDT